MYVRINRQFITYLQAGSSEQIQLKGNHYMINSTLSNISFLYAASLSPLDREAEHELAVKMTKGDKKARETLILSNIRFAIQCARKYKSYNLDHEDLVSIAVAGLINGVDHFDVKRNTRIITCAAWWIRAEFKKHCETQEEETVESSSDALKLFMKNQPDEESMTPDESAIYSCFKDVLYKNINALPREERTVFMMHNGLGGYSKLNFAEIGKRYGKTKQWAWLKAKSADKFIASKMSDWA